MGALTKKVVTEVTFRQSTSTADDVQYVKIKYDAEGAGRYFELSDGTNQGTIFLTSADDFRQMYEAAKEMEAQGSIYFESEEW